MYHCRNLERLKNETGLQFVVKKAKRTLSWYAWWFLTYHIQENVLGQERTFNIFWVMENYFYNNKYSTTLWIIVYTTISIINTNTCPQPLADLIWLNYRARKSGWFCNNKRAKQLKLEAKNIWFSKTQTSNCQEQQQYDLCAWDVEKGEEYKPTISSPHNPIF